MIASLAPSREKSSSDPVTTMVRPSSVRATDSSRSSARETPAARHLSTISWCQSTCRHSTMASAMIPPTPSVAASSSWEAAQMASREPNSVASARAADGPTWRMDSATSTRHSGTCLRSSRLRSRPRALALRTRSPAPASFSAFFAARVKKAVVARPVSSRSKMSPSLVITSAASSASAAS